MVPYKDVLINIYIKMMLIWKIINKLSLPFLSAINHTLMRELLKEFTVEQADVSLNHEALNLKNLKS